jgi:hypothetical protein
MDCIPCIIDTVLNRYLVWNCQASDPRVRYKTTYMGDASFSHAAAAAAAAQHLAIFNLDQAFVNIQHDL